MKAALDIKMDRPVEKGFHYITPGGYVIRSKDKLVSFDFDESSWDVDPEDPSILHCEMSKFSSEDASERDFVGRILPEAAQLIDCFVYVGEKEEDPEIRLEKVLGFRIWARNETGAFRARSNGCVRILIDASDIEFVFTDEAIGSFNRTLGE